MYHAVKVKIFKMLPSYSMKNKLEGQEIIRIKIS